MAVRAGVGDVDPDGGQGLGVAVRLVPGCPAPQHGPVTVVSDSEVAWVPGVERRCQRGDDSAEVRLDAGETEFAVSVPWAVLTLLEATESKVPTVTRAIVITREMTTMATAISTMP